MPAYLPPLLALGIPAALGVAAFLHYRRTMDGPDAPIVVVDRRTMRLAQRRIPEAIEAKRWARANAGLISLIAWLRRERRTGPRRHRVAYAYALEQAELRKAELHRSLGLPGYRV